MNYSSISRDKRKKLGFTIVEISLFLALSGLLAVGLIAGVNDSITRQRYNDSTNDLADFLRNAYSDTMNVSNSTADENQKLNGGRTGKAIYGKLITFGEANDSVASRTIYAYDVVGKAISSASATSPDVVTMLENELDANIINQNNCNPTSCTNSFYRIVSYNIPWDGELQKPNNGTSVDKSLFTGAILIVRSPNAGGIQTFVYQGAITDFHNKAGENRPRTDSDLFKNLLSQLKGGKKDLDMCLDSPDNRNANRRNFRILKGANNTTGVYLVGLDDTDTDTGKGSKCLGAGH